MEEIAEARRCGEIPLVLETTPALSLNGSRGHNIPIQLNEMTVLDVLCVEEGWAEEKEPGQTRESDDGFHETAPGKC
jgi:hypothetical protein